MRAKTTSTGQKIITRQTRIADPWSSVHSSQQHEILSKSIARSHPPFDLTVSVERRFMAPKDPVYRWRWQGSLVTRLPSQKSKCSRPGAAGWWRIPSATTRWSAWTSSWRTARGNRSEGSNVVSMLWGDQLWVVLVVREVTRPQNIFTRVSV